MSFLRPRGRLSWVVAAGSVCAASLWAAPSSAQTDPVPAEPAPTPAPAAPAQVDPAAGSPTAPTAPATASPLGTPPPANASGAALPSELRPQEPQKDPEKKDEEPSRLSELFWVNGELGASYANMRTFSVENLGITNADGAGLMAGIGAGLRLVFVSLGARLRWHRITDFALVQANGELLFKIPVSKVDIIIGLHGGYSGVGSLGDLFSSGTPAAADALASSVSIKGWNAGLDLGFDYFINNYFSLGLGITGDFLYLQRPKSTLPPEFDQLPAETQAEYLNSDVYRFDGSSAGFGVATALRVGFHLGP